jgi:3-oxoacyl-[acyl-carrier protein] reductase
VEELMKKLAGKVALVTGSSRGIGRAIAKRLAEDGALVIINYASGAEAANSLAAEIATGGGEALAIQARLGSAAETKKLFSVFESALRGRDGGARLNILVNNAGVGHFGKVSEATEENFDEVFAANTKAPFLVTKSALPFLAPRSRIINISSGASRRPETRFGLYAMSKAAVDVMTVALAAELGAKGITVNTVAPGWTATDANVTARQDAALVRTVENQTALGRLGAPDDIARVVAFLASDDGGWITGQYIEASGGFKLL